MGLNLSNWLEESGKDFIFFKKKTAGEKWLGKDDSWLKKPEKAAAYSFPKCLLFGAAATEQFDRKGCSLFSFMLCHLTQQY